MKNEDPNQLMQKHPDWQIKTVRDSGKPVLVTFGAGGSTVYFATEKDQTSVRRSTQTGYRSPETFFNIYHWWADHHLSQQCASQYQGVPYIDMRKAVETKAGIHMAIQGPMLDVDLHDDEIDRLPEPSDMMMAGLMYEQDKSYAGMMLLHKSAKLARPEVPGPLDGVSIKVYMEMWRKAGATVGHILEGTFIPMPDKKGQIFHHYQEVYREMGRAKARAFPGDSDSGVVWYLFKDISDEDLKNYLRAYGIQERRPSVSHDCSGQMCSSSPTIRCVGKRVLVKHSWYLDI